MMSMLSMMSSLMSTGLCLFGSGLQSLWTTRDMKTSIYGFFLRNLSHREKPEKGLFMSIDVHPLVKAGN